MAQIKQIEAATTTTPVSLVTTAETIVLTSSRMEMSGDAARILILAWAQLTTGTGTTGITPRLRRGTLVTGTLVGSAILEGNKVAATGTEPFFLMLIDTPAANDAVQYVFTLQQAGAGANGSSVQATIALFALA